MFETAGPGGAVDQSSRIEAMQPRNYAQAQRGSKFEQLPTSLRIAWLGARPQ
jgi:hypothetical protein